jgi:putative ABC transport system permease protein
MSSRRTRLEILRPWLIAFASLILIGACANLANLIFASGLARETEVALRLSLGASRRAIAGLFVAEAAVIAGAAAIVGGGVAAGGLRYFSAAWPVVAAGSLHGRYDFTPDIRVALVALATGAFGGLIVGLLTAWRAVRTPHLRVLAVAGQGTTPRDGWSRTAMVAVQITSAVVLLIAAGLYFQNTPGVPDIRLGFDTSHVVAGEILSGRIQNPTRRAAFEAGLLDAARKLAGVDGAALAASLPAGVGGAGPPNVTLGAEDLRGFTNLTPRRVLAQYSAVTPGFLHTIDLPLLEGRDFGPGDADGAPKVAILSHAAASQLWPGESALGKRVEFGRGLMATVIGISADPVTMSSESPLNAPSNYAFCPLDQWKPLASPDRYFVFRSNAPEAATAAVQAAAHGLDEDIVVARIARLDQAMFDWYAPRRAIRWLMTAASLVAIGIALLGVYGVITYFVSARTREFGVRMALGATPGRLVRMVVDHAIHIVLIGLLAGVFVASVTTRIVEHDVFNTMPNGEGTWIAVPILILAAGVAAGFLPARRAAAVDPIVSLRE